LRGQSFSTSFLAANLPVFPLALAAGALVIAKALARALNFKECPALSICADANCARLQEFSPEYAVQ
jgi:hypothetical protein